MLDEIIILMEQGTRKPIEIKTSGTKRTVKIVAPIATLLASIRSMHIDPAKGTQNPPHIHVKTPKQK